MNRFIRRIRLRLPREIISRATYPTMEPVVRVNPTTEWMVALAEGGI